MYSAHFENKTVSRYFFLFLWIVYTIVYMTKNCFSAAMATIVEQGVLTLTQTGLINSVFYIIYAPLQIVGGILVDKYDPEKLIMVGLFGSGISNLIIFINQNYYLMLVVWAFNACTQFAVWPAIFKIVSSQLIRSDRKSSAFYITFCTSAGLLLAYLIAAFIPKWQYNFLISAVMLIALGIAMCIICKKIDRYFVPDKPIVVPKQIKTEADGYDSTWKMFMASGFFLVVVASFMSCFVEISVKNFTPTLLTNMYSGIVTPSIGNLLNILIIVMGMIGMILVKTVIYPKYIKNEVLGVAIMLVISIPFVLLFKFIGKINILFIIAAMGFFILFITSTNLFVSYYNMFFSKYGKSGTAAGIVNAAASMSIIVQSYSVAKAADVYGWESVMDIWIIFTVIAAVFSVITIPIWRKFKLRTY